VQVRRRNGLRLRFSALLGDDVCMVAGVPVTSVVRTAFDVGRWTAWPESVVSLDAFAAALRLHLGLVAEIAECRPGWRGTPQLRRGVALADPRARSRGESRMRLLWVLEAQLPAPQSNAAVRLLDGRLLGVVDLLDPASGLVGEYDGSGHREALQHADDNAREEGLEAADLTVVRLGGPDLSRGRRLRSVERLRTAHARAIERTLLPKRWTWSSPKIDIDVRHAVRS